MMLCRRHIAQVFLRPPSFTSRSIFTSISRPVCITTPKPRMSRARANRLFSTNQSQVPPKFDCIINPDEYEKLLAHANQCWPPPPSVPPKWSCTWSEWEALLSYYWVSPCYLMLPAIEMHVNIQYGIRGEARPVLFSNERDSFIFNIVNSKKYFLFDGPYMALYRIKDVHNDHQLVELVKQGDDALVAKLKAVEESEEGLAVIQRILRRDETVIPLLAEKFLHYTPVPTTPQMERNSPDSSPELDAEFAEYMSDWQREEDTSGQQARELTEKELEEDEKLIRKELSRFANNPMVASEEDIPPERAERETRILKKKIDEIIQEMEDFPRPVEPPQKEAFEDMITTAKSIREGLDELSLSKSHAMASWLTRTLHRNFGLIKADPKALEFLARA